MTYLEQKMQNNLHKRIKFGEIGEHKFEDFCKRNDIWCQRFGITTRDSYAIPKQMFYKIPKLIKSAPDFLMVNKKFHFVECKMADKNSGMHVKIKQHDMKHYQTWANVGDLLFYIYNFKYNEAYLVEFYYIAEFINNKDYKQGMYNENGRYYYEVLMDDIRAYGRQL
tara:strand:- start:20576 stop:21076 length:501 start_codon:yes stop_codon:yes gene_type:complete